MTDDIVSGQATALDNYLGTNDQAPYRQSLLPCWAAAKKGLVAQKDAKDKVVSLLQVASTPSVFDSANQADQLPLALTAQFTKTFDRGRPVVDKISQWEINTATAKESREVPDWLRKMALEFEAQSKKRDADMPDMQKLARAASRGSIECNHDTFQYFAEGYPVQHSRLKAVGDRLWHEGVKFT